MHGNNKGHTNAKKNTKINTWPQEAILYPQEASSTIYRRPKFSMVFSSFQSIDGYPRWTPWSHPCLESTQSHF